MATHEEQLWHYTRTFMMSGCTNPSPDDYVDGLARGGVTQAQKNSLINQVNGWEGIRTANAVEVKNTTISAITRAPVSEF